MARLTIITIFLSFFVFHHGDAANILAVFPTQMKSHFIVGKHLLKELALAGHDVTVICPFKIKNPPKTYHEITTTIPDQSFIDYANAVSKTESIDPSMFFKFLKWGMDVNEATLKDPAVQKLMKSGKKFDVMLYELFINEAILGLAHHLKVPVIGVSTLGLSAFVTYYTGSNSPNSFVPNLMLGLPEEMSFKERLINTIGNLYFDVMMKVYFDPANEKCYQENFPDPKPTLDELRRTAVSMVLTNSHISLNGPKPFMSNVVEVGGIHIDEKLKPLPEDLQKFLDSSDEGVVYFCMGSTISPNAMLPEKRDAIIKGLSSIKEKVVWKWDHESGKTVDPTKFYTSTWLPQNEILAHKNVKLFITHGGLLGTTEAVYHGVPLMGIPMFADQKTNMVSFRHTGLGLLLEYTNLTETSFKEMLDEMLATDRYQIKSKEVARRFRDRPSNALQTAIYWIEYVVRHKGAKFMQSSALKLNNLQYYNLDVYGLMAFVVFLVLYLPYKLVKCICCRRKTGKSKTE
ncbi:UDP-glycosyltransferase UGT5-like [Culicoides brevitarsis]|uniref:UDP-glycosyltransferase UGT5-like n=1 Tax=Culicoides brevitarsis TaxID=469753 RepID=UPI00307B7D39